MSLAVRNRSGHWQKFALTSRRANARTKGPAKGKGKRMRINPLTKLRVILGPGNLGGTRKG